MLTQEVTAGVRKRWQEVMTGGWLPREAQHFFFRFILALRFALVVRDFRKNQEKAVSSCFVGSEKAVSFCVVGKEPRRMQR